MASVRGGRLVVIGRGVKWLPLAHNLFCPTASLPLVISATGAEVASSLLSGVWYDAKYVVENRVEINISENLVAAWSHERRPRLASVAASAPFARVAAPASHNDEAAAATAKLRVSEEKTRELEAITEK